RFSTLMAYFSGQVNAKPVTQAQWYDGDGILYSIPVNARRPSLSFSSFMNYSTPLDAKKNWFLTINGSVGYNTSLSYQTRKSLPGLDKDHFDYSAFLDDFWGDAEGNRFYGGASGFEESRTRSFTPYARMTVRYNQERWSFSANAGINGRIARYSLDPSVNMNTLDTRFGGEVSYTTKHEFEIESDLDYVFYKGYSAGYGLPEWQWNAEITKSIGAFNLSLSVHDILNQTRNLTHTVTANYEEDSYRLVMGRYILFGVKWNFGKMNAGHSARAQQAAMNMVF
ncbi:MAG: outer membrane beta-barrel protein, partial [Bacteroidales bacterium]|nr:outer membrane beta-barrel protein [Bacteroidales bacterium]